MHRRTPSKRRAPTCTRSQSCSIFSMMCYTSYPVLALLLSRGWLGLQCSAVVMMGVQSFYSAVFFVAAENVVVLTAHKMSVCDFGVC